MAAKEIRFSEDARADEVEDDAADIVGRTDAPMLKDRGHHRAELFQGICPEPTKEFRPADVLSLLALAMPLPFYGEIERIARVAFELARLR